MKVVNQTVLIAQMQQWSLKTQQRFSEHVSMFRTSSSAIIISHYKCIEEIYKMIGIYNYSYTI